ncbi:hypothetical protein OKW41_001375 [Paraburkholderia sp. UCT70]
MRGEPHPAALPVDRLPAGRVRLSQGEKAPQEQIDALEKALQDISGKGHTPPPGFHAQLGMLYASVGNDTQAMQEFESEKQLFPESSTYMDFLMKKPKQP